LRYIKAAACLPAKVWRKEVSAKVRTQTAGSDGAKPMVVVVDNDAAVLGALKFALELEGFAVTPFRSAAEVLAEKDLPASGCLVVDFNLSGMNGLDLVAALRDRSVSLPAILIAGSASPDVRRRAAAASMPIVEKPLFGNALLNAINAKIA
jgi:two-component system, LuxR family, response regulator FixJ